MNHADRRKPCIIFLSCIGAGPKYFLQLSGDFRRRYYIASYLFNDRNLLPKMFSVLETEMECNPVLVYHEPDWLPFLGDLRDAYDEFLDKIPADATKISVPQAGFQPFWPFHSGDPRNGVPDGPRNWYDKPPSFPYGDSYVLRLINQGLPPDEVIRRYLSVDVAEEVDLDKLLERTRSLLERQDRTGAVKVADFICTGFRSKNLFQTLNHMNNTLCLYIANQVLRLLDCEPVPESVLLATTEIVERPMPVHPSIAKHFGVNYIDEDTRYPIDEIRNLTFAEYISEYVHYESGILNYTDGLLNNPAVG